ncbi:MAG: GNAT family N-acetyltransferase [Clostridium sp.]|uniref:GNAT family N-acetyltransferase n=1 Tax=Clostridium sp. TaxID=1506 RepID=UPI003D6CCCDD
MDCNELFNSYYLKYLGISIQEVHKEKKIFQCSQRKKPINNCFFQHLIVTNIDGINTFSVTPKLYRDFSKYIIPFKNMETTELFKVLRVFFDSRLEIYTIREMYRMTLDITYKRIPLQNSIVKLTKEIFINNLQTVSEEEKQRIWLRKKDEVIQGRQYIILDGNKIASYCKVSNIDYNGGNLTVYTNEKYRNKGYGKSVSIGAINWCIENEVIPVYWVDKKNMPSVALAKSLGFKIRSEEIVVGTNYQI